MIGKHTTNVALFVRAWIEIIDQFKGAARDLGGFINSLGIDFRLSNSK